MLAKDRLHIVSLVLTTGAVILVCTGSFLPNWWILKNRSTTTNDTFSLFGDIHCGDSICVPSYYKPEEKVVPEPTAGPDAGITNGSTADAASTVQPEGYTVVDDDNKDEGLLDFIGLGDNAVWLVAGRVLCIVSLSFVILSLVCQLIFFLYNHEKVQMVALALNIGGALFSFIAGFHFLNKFRALTEVYVNERPPGALTYTPAAPACLLIASLLGVVAVVFAAYAFHPPDHSGPILKGKTQSYDVTERERFID